MEELKLSAKLLYSLIIQSILLPFRLLSMGVGFIEIIVVVLKKTINSFIEHILSEAIK